MLSHNLDRRFERVRLGTSATAESCASWANCMPCKIGSFTLNKGSMKIVYGAVAKAGEACAWRCEYHQRRWDWSWTWTRPQEFIRKQSAGQQLVRQQCCRPATRRPPVCQRHSCMASRVAASSETACQRRSLGTGKSVRFQS